MKIINLKADHEKAIKAEQKKAKKFEKEIAETKRKII